MSHLKCVICLEKYDEAVRKPLMLQCGHTFSKDCLSQIAKYNGITCPTCRNEDHRNIELIPVNYALQEGIVEMARRVDKGKVQELEGLRQVKDRVTSLMSQLDELSLKADTEENKTLQAMESDFEVLRAMLSDCQEQVRNRVAITHLELKDQLLECRNQVKAFLGQVSAALAKNGPSSEATNIALRGQIDVEISKVKSLKAMIETLPVKVTVGTRNFDMWLSTHVKMLDQTNINPTELHASFIRDVTIEDGSIMPPGFSFNKIWRIRNSGSVPWPEGCWCICSGGDFNGTTTIVNSAWPQEEVDVCIICTSPLVPGRARSYWRLINPEGKAFGVDLWVDIEVQH